MQKTFARIVAGLTGLLFTLSTLAQTLPTSTFAYDVAGQLTAVTEPSGQSHAFQYSPFGELAVHQQPNPGGSGAAGQVLYGYNGQGALTSITDPRGLVTHYARDGHGDVGTLTSPDTGVTNAVFDEAGNRASYTDARGTNVTATYDALNRPTSVNYGSSFAATYGYDAGQGVGQLTSMTDSSGSTLWSHDKLGRVVGRSQSTSGVTLEVGYSYYPGGRVASITYPSGAVVGFNYDGANISSITVNGSTAIYGVAYAPFGAPMSWNMGLLGSYSRQADTYGRITSHTTEYGSRTLTWDASSRLSGIAESGQGGRTYGYDNLNRLTSATELAARTYGYDLTGNRTAETANGTSFGYGVDSASNRLSASSNETGSKSYSFDAAGNMTSDGSKSFAYDGAGQLTQVTAASGVIAQYAYNGLGQRVKKVTGAGARYFVYAEDGVSLLGEYEAAGASTPVSETVYLDGIPVMVLKGGAAYFVLPDHLNTPRAVKNTAGATVWRWNSDAFGNGAADENPSGLFQFAFNQRFPGQQFDAETALHYNNARYYDPSVGRYVTSDLIGLAGGINTYAYALGQPLMLTDVDGLCPCGSVPGLLKDMRSDQRDWSQKGDRRFDSHVAFGPGSNKCNLFVDVHYEATGFHLPNVGGEDWLPRQIGFYPPGAQTLSNPAYVLSGWPVVQGAPQPGDLAAFAGHVAIVSGPGRTISATDKFGKVENNWGFREEQIGVVFRRCTCSK